MSDTNRVISPETIAEALAGHAPSLGHALAADELGARLAAHRRGRFPGQAFSRAAISLYRLHPEQQSLDFVEAFRSWVAAETLRQDRLRVRFGGLTADELLSEAGYIQQLGEDPVKAIIAVGELPAGTLIGVNGTAAAVECTAEVKQCACGQWFVRRNWRHRRCAECGRQRR